jgi:hypothetical protein
MDTSKKADNYEYIIRCLQAMDVQFVADYMGVELRQELLNVLIVDWVKLVHETNKLPKWQKED